MITTTPIHEKTFPADELSKLPRPFIFRRLHSLLGFWLVIYLFEHLLVNSQAALFFHDEGHGFINMVNSLESIPYLPLVEIVFLGLPFFIHIVWGIKYLFTSKPNAHRTDGTKPALPQYKRNRRYSWQRITSWILVFGVVLHVIHMRFLDRPYLAFAALQEHYMVRVSRDNGLYGVADKIQATLLDRSQLAEKKESLLKEEEKLQKLDPSSESYFHLKDQIGEKREWLKTASARPLKKNQLLAITPSAGGAFFLVVREAFKSPTLVLLYSVFVIAAVYHAFNGVWTFMIAWGITLTRRSQKVMRLVANFFMWLVMLFGLGAAWGTYWTTLFQV